MPDMPNAKLGRLDHEQHDLLLVSRHADEDLDAQERATVETLLARCAACRDVFEDLRAISRAVALDPAPPRPRDFRLSAREAERARGSLLQRLLRRLALPDLALLRPLAGGAMALGLLLVVVGSVLPSPMVPASDADVRLTQPTSEPNGSDPGEERLELGNDDVAVSKSADPAADAGATPDVESAPAADDGPALMSLPEGVSDPATEADSTAERAGAADPENDAASSQTSGVVGPEDTSATIAPQGPEGEATVEQEPRSDAGETSDMAGSTGPGAVIDARVLAMAAGMALTFLGFLVAVVIMLARRHSDPLLR